MGFTWSRFCEELHHGIENEQSAAHRLARTPPEMWTGKDHMLARRLRYRREVARDKAVREGKDVERALVRYPEGPFWPFPASDIESRREKYIKSRIEEEIYSRQGHHGQHGLHPHHERHGQHGNHGAHPDHGQHVGEIQAGWQNHADEWRDLL